MMTKHDPNGPLQPVSFRLSPLHVDILATVAEHRGMHKADLIKFLLDTLRGEYLLVKSTKEATNR
jgi:hypothetical protein